MRQINLLPEAYQHQMRMAALKKTMIVSAVIVIVCIVPVHIWLADGVKGLKNELTAIKLSRAMPELDKVRSEVTLLRNERNAFVSENQALLEIAAQRVHYKAMMKLIGDSARNKVWLNSVTVSSQKKTLEMKGKAYDAQLVSEFLLEIKKIPYFNTVDLTSMQSNTAADGTTITFSLTCTFE
ncbi:MAG: PilN domain-containing protein [Candidatus Omnitrophica bacterium]|nr:PilN domain-containing protein [Candidatus Omnitrophota bacterium]